MSRIFITGSSDGLGLMAAQLLERVSKIGSASNQVLTHEVSELLIFCHEEAAEVVDGRAVATD